MACIKYPCAISKSKWRQDLIRGIEIAYKFLTDCSKIVYNIALVKWALKVIWMNLESVMCTQRLSARKDGSTCWFRIPTEFVRFALVKLSIVNIRRHLPPHKPELTTNVYWGQKSQLPTRLQVGIGLQTWS